MRDNKGKPFENPVTSYVSKFLPLAVSLYFCIRVLGLSGMVYSMNRASIAGCR